MDDRNVEPVLSDIAGLFGDLTGSFESIFSLYRFNADPRSVYLTCLFLTQCEYLGAIGELMRSRYQIAIPALVRSFLEAYIDFENLHLTDKYLRHMFANYLHESKRVFQVV